ncbi:MAG: DUF1566 domain-containing protein, partial [Nitrospirae bacterium]|nr:DUF1566 domain-containing protein [Nitrospirota bacterium]
MKRMNGFFGGLFVNGKWKMHVLLFTVLLFAAFLVPVQSAIVDMNDGTVYDTDLEISWLQDGNYAYTSGYAAASYGRMTWDDAKAWIDTLNAANFKGFNNWRLPETAQPDTTCSYIEDPGGGFPLVYAGWVCSGSELGHLYYTELGNIGRCDASGNNCPQPGWGLTNTGPFINAQADAYWSGTVNTARPDTVFIYYFSIGGQENNYKTWQLAVWPVSPGARSISLRIGQTTSIPRTGQTTSYASDDDGAIQAGVVWPSPRFTDNGDQTATDNLTGLMWTRDVSFPSLAWQDALNYIASMNAGSSPNFGHTDWRLPTVNELQSLVNLEVPNQEDWLNAVGGYGNPFTNVHGYFYWSSTVAAGLSGSAWMVNLHYGDVNMWDRTVDIYFWPVRGPVSSAPALVWRTGQTISLDTNTPPADDGALQTGVAWPSPRFTDNLNGTVTDNLTGLVWLRNADCFGTQAWSTALGSANALANGACGLTDGSTAGQWRLPNREELYSLIDFSTWGPSFPAVHPFINLQACGYWTSTTEADWTANAWGISFLDSDVNMGNKEDLKDVWPVRDGTVAADDCPNDPNKTATGICGCGIADTDSDSDGTADCNDGCSADPLKIAQGICGCGVADTDSDSDGTADCNDACPADPLKIGQGNCGCGVPETDVCPGSNVTVTPAPVITLTFDNVTTGGDATATEITNPTPDENFRIVSGKSYDIDFTGAFSGTVTVCVNYNDSDVSGNGSNLKLMHRGSSGGWTDITTSHDTVNNIICGVTGSFSEFAVTEPADATPPTPNFGYTTSGLTANVDSSASACAGSCLYAWSWDDGNTTPYDIDATVSHQYALAGTYQVTLTVKDAVNQATETKTSEITVYPPDAKPAADGCGAGEYSWNANTWTFTCTPASTDDHGVVKEIIKWNDGTANYVDATAPFEAASHTFTTSGLKL